jgi:acetoin utilization protein AcuC
MASTTDAVFFRRANPFERYRSIRVLGGATVKTAFLYTDQYFHYDYGSGHPLKIERLRLAHDLCKAYGLFDLPGTQRIEAEPARESDILRFHTGAYVDVLKQASAGRFHGFYAHGLGFGDNPIFPGLWEWSLLHTGATLQCARLVSEGLAEIAFNVAGGLHHACPDRASGFCYVNDVVLALYHFLDRGQRVLYLDIDAHHGDGVQWAFYEDPRVLTVSFHQDGSTLFPGTGSVQERGKGKGLGYAVNVPMLPGTDDRVFLQGFHAVVPRLLKGFAPDVLVTQLGVDTFRDDPLAALELTSNGFVSVVSFLKDSALPWVALGGGGYQVRNVARAWTLAWAVMNGVDLPDDLPPSMKDAFPGPGQRLRDPEHAGKGYDRCRQHMAEVVAYLERKVLPIHGAK